MEKKKKKTAKKSSMKKLHEKAAKHLKGDIKGYAKERKYLKHEIEEDKQLMKEFKRTKNGKKNVKSR